MLGDYWAKTESSVQFSEPFFHQRSTVEHRVSHRYRPHHHIDCWTLCSSLKESSPQSVFGSDLLKPSNNRPIVVRIAIIFCLLISLISMINDHSFSDFLYNCFLLYSITTNYQLKTKEFEWARVPVLVLTLLPTLLLWYCLISTIHHNILVWFRQQKCERKAIES